jgi:hypothetical protein
MSSTRKVRAHGLASGPMAPRWPRPPSPPCPPGRAADRPPRSRAAVRLLREELQHLQEPGSYVGEVIKASRDAAAPLRPARRGSGPARAPPIAALCMRVLAPTAFWPAWPRPGRTHDAHAPAHPTWPQVMGKNKVLVKVHPEGKYVVDVDKDIDVNKLVVRRLLARAQRARAALRRPLRSLPQPQRKALSAGLDPARRRRWARAWRCATTATSCTCACPPRWTRSSA